MLNITFDEKLFLFSPLMTKKEFSEIKGLLSQPKNHVIIPHRNPDGDAMGSSLALYEYLVNKGHEAVVLAPTSYPDFLKWMPNNDKVVIFEYNEKKGKELLDKADVIFFMDFNALDRIENIKPYILENKKAVKIMIDHHQQPEDFPDYTFSDTSICATSQMLYHFFENIDEVDAINANMATCIYTGILTDTGSFRFPSTTAITHKITADLIERGAVNHQIHSNVFDGNSQARMKLMGVALNNMHVLEDSRSAYITISRKELQENNFKKGDTEGFVNLSLSINGINVAAIFIEDLENDYIKVSLRSKGKFSVNQLSRDHFNGGGHINAAGGRLDTSIEEAVELFKNVVDINKEDIIHSNE